MRPNNKIRQRTRHRTLNREAQRGRCRAPSSENWYERHQLVIVKKWILRYGQDGRTLKELVPKDTCNHNHMLSAFDFHDDDSELGFVEEFFY